MIALAKKYEQQSVLVWSYENQQATLYATTDFKTYHKEMTFDTFAVDAAKDYVWSEYKSHNFAFKDSTDPDNDVEAEYVVESATEMEFMLLGNWMTRMGAQSTLRGLISSYGGCIDDYDGNNNELIIV